MTVYRLYRKKVLAISTVGNIDGRYLDEKWSPTEVTFKARNEKEAMKKARKFWEEGQFGMGQITVLKTGGFGVSRNPFFIRSSLFLS